MCNVFYRFLHFLGPARQARQGNAGVRQRMINNVGKLRARVRVWLNNENIKKTLAPIMLFSNGELHTNPVSLHHWQWLQTNYKIIKSGQERLGVGRQSEFPLHERSKTLYYDVVTMVTRYIYLLINIKAVRILNSSYWGSLTNNNMYLSTWSFSFLPYQQTEILRPVIFWPLRG